MNKVISVEEIATELEWRDYYETTAWECIVEAVEQALADLGIAPRACDIDDIDNYIRKELI